VRTLNVDNVNEALQLGMMLLKKEGIEIMSRNGPTIECPSPVTTSYRNPWRRVLFDPQRDANPFFHFMESLWILAGRNDVAFLDYWNSNIKRYSDDGIKYHGAYGHRMRKFDDYRSYHEPMVVDQLDWAIEELRKDPYTRRCVVQIWDARKDMQPNPDIPCNDLLIFRCRDGRRLDMTVCNRSNDIIWGAYGANAVHFSIVHEYVAWHAKLNMGSYHQISNSYHAYTDNPYWQTWHQNLLDDPYQSDLVLIQLCFTPLFDIQHDHAQTDRWLKLFFAKWGMDHTLFKFSEQDFQNQPAFMKIAVAMCRAWAMHKMRVYPNAYVDLHRIPSAFADWQIACEQWLHRREKAWLAKQEAA